MRDIQSIELRLKGFSLYPLYGKLGLGGHSLNSYTEEKFLLYEKLDKNAFE
jgi:hypothetical protein